MATAAEFVEALRALKAISGLSLRELHQRSGLPRSTIAHTLNGKRVSFPPWDRVLALLRACGVPEGSLPQWKDAWAEILLDSEPGIASRMEGGSDQGGVQDTAWDGGWPGTQDSHREGRPACPGGPATSSEAAGSHAGDVAGREARGMFLSGVPRRRGVRLMLLVLTHGVALALGVVLGVTLTGTSGGVQAGYPVEEQSCPSLPAGQSPVTGAPHGGDAFAKDRPSWVARPASDKEILSGTDVVLPVLTPVTAGDSLVVSIMLTSTCPGRVEVTDTRGDAFAVVGDVTDSRRHRTLIIAGFGVRALGTADSIHVVYPHASKYHVAVDEYRGISEATGHAQAYGESGGTAFSTGSVRLDCTQGELLVGAVGANTGSEPVFTAEWHPLPELKLSSYRLSTGYRVVSAAQLCAVTGTTTAQWGAVVVAFR